MQLRADPAKITDLVFHNQVAKSVAESFAAEHIHWLYLQGEAGTGKSIAAPVLIKERVPDINWAADVVNFNARADNGIDNLPAKFESLSYVGNNSKGTRVLLIEEVDRLTLPGHLMLRGHLDKINQFKSPVPIIVTTNEPDALDKPVRSRFAMVHWDYAPADQVIPRVQQVLAQNGELYLCATSGNLSSKHKVICGNCSGSRCHWLSSIKKHSRSAQSN